jgi:hypothetical protein
MPTEPLEQKQAHTEAPISLAKLTACSLCVLCVLLLLEALFSSTALITPISQNLVYGLWAVGLLVGLAVSFCITRLEPKIFGLYYKIVLIIYALGVFWACGDGFAWRIADRLAFGFFPKSPFTPAIYPVADTNKPWKGQRASIEINPSDRSATRAIHIRTNGRYTAFEPKPVELSACPQR